MVFVRNVHMCICMVHVHSYMYLLEDKQIMLGPKIVIMHGCLSPGVNVKGKLPSPVCSAKPKTSYWLKMS